MSDQDIAREGLNDAREAMNVPHTRSKLTVTEAETLATLLDHASRKMAKVKTRVPGTDRYEYVWNRNASEAFAEMCAGFYAIAPMGIYI